MELSPDGRVGREDRGGPRRRGSPRARVGGNRPGRDLRQDQGREISPGHHGDVRRWVRAGCAMSGVDRAEDEVGSIEGDDSGNRDGDLAATGEHDRQRVTGDDSQIRSEVATDRDLARLQLPGRKPEQTGGGGVRGVDSHDDAGARLGCRSGLGRCRAVEVHQVEGLNCTDSRIGAQRGRGSAGIQLPARGPPGRPRPDSRERDASALSPRRTRTGGRWSRGRPRLPPR